MQRGRSTREEQGRWASWGRLLMAEAEIDREYLDDVLERHGLMEVYRQWTG